MSAHSILSRSLAALAALGAAWACLPELKIGALGASDGGADAALGDAGVDGAGILDAATDATSGCGPACAAKSSTCATYACLFDQCALDPAAAGVDCTDNGGKRCDGLGQCVLCRVDGVVNDGETGTDCGGPDCQACADLQGCAVAADCVSGKCDQQLCVPPTCSDGILNGNEAAVDCGGTCFYRCKAGEQCNASSDCESGSCAGAYCCAPSCSGVCRECAAVTGACGFVTAGTDPRDECPGPTNKCDGLGACQTCSDLTINAGETDFDCGGPVCPKCAQGAKCLVNADCQSCACSSGACVAPACSDGLKDGCESDVDCGGPCGSTCVLGQACASKADCVSNSCVAGVCVAP